MAWEFGRVLKRQVFLKLYKCVLGVGFVLTDKVLQRFVNRLYKVDIPEHEEFTVINEEQVFASLSLADNSGVLHDFSRVKKCD